MMRQLYQSLDNAVQYQHDHGARGGHTTIGSSVRPGLEFRRVPLGLAGNHSLNEEAILADYRGPTDPAWGPANRKDPPTPRDRER
jgi:hypothetical protein